jgi:hypothetical protein
MANLGIKNSRFKHGMSRDPLYMVWSAMKRRCYNKNTKDYEGYGGRGITVCSLWRTDFQAFRDWALAHGYAKGLQIDRRDNNGHYTPDNCRFVTATESARNRRCARIVVAFGEIKTVAAWQEDNRCMVKSHTLIWRLNNGWTAEESLTMTVGANRKLAEDTIRSIREERAGGATITALAKKYGVDHSNISAIVLRRTWRHVQ